MKRLALLLLVLTSSAWGQMLQAMSTAKPPAGVGSFTHIQAFPTSVGCSGSTTCSMALPASLTAGSLVTIQCYVTNSVQISSVNVGGTIVPVYSASGEGNTNTLFPASGYIVSASATAGPVVVTFTGAMGAGTTCYGHEFSYDTGTPKLDWAASRLHSGTTSVTGETPVFSGTKDVQVQDNNTDYQVTTAVAGTGWTGGKFDASNGPGWAYKINSIDTTAPTWTISSGSGNAASNGFAFATDATTCNDVALIDFSGGTATNNLTQATLRTSTFGGQGDWGTATGTPAASETFQTAAHVDLINAFSTCNGHKTGAGTLGLKFDTSASTSYYFPYTLTAANGKYPFSSVSVGFWYIPHIGTSDTGFYSMNSTQDSGGLDFVSVMLNAGEVFLEAKAGPDHPIDCAGTGCNANNKFSYTQDHQYWITYQMNKYVANGTSTTSLAIGTGTKTFTTQAGLGYTAGQLVVANNTTANWMAGTVSSYSGTTLVLSVTVVGGSGTLASWTFTSTMDKMSIYDSDGSTLLATMQKAAYLTTPNNPDAFFLGRIGDSGTTAGSYVYTSNVKISYAGTFPLLP